MANSLAQGQPFLVTVLSAPKSRDSLRLRRRFSHRNDVGTINKRLSWRNTLGVKRPDLSLQNKRSGTLDGSGFAIALIALGCFWWSLPPLILHTQSFRKILAPMKIKSALPPPPPQKPQIPPPLKRGILWTWLLLQNGRIFPGVHKIGADISGPRIVDKNVTDTRIFYVKSLPERVPGDKFLFLPWKVWWNFRKFWEWQILSRFSLGIYEIKFATKNPPSFSRWGVGVKMQNFIT